MSLLAGGPGRLAGGPVRLGGGGWAAWLAPAAEEEAFCRSAALAACRLEQVECVDLSECEVATEFEVDTECVDYSDLAAQLAQAQELCDALADECMELRALAWRLRGGARGKPHDELVVGGGYEVDDGVDADGSECEALGELESIVGCDGDVFSKDGSGCDALLAKESIMGCDGDAFDKDSIVGCDVDAFGKDGSGCEALDALERIVGCDGGAVGNMESIVGCDGDAYDGDEFGKDSIVGCDGDAFGKVPPFPTLSEVAVESELELKDAPAQEGALGQAVLGPRVACWADALEQQQAGEQCEQFVDPRDWDMVFLANSAAAARREAALDARAAAERLVPDVLVEMPVDVEAFGCKKKAKKKQHKKLLRADVVGATVGLDSVAAEDPRPPGAAGVWAFLEKAYAAGVPPDIAANLVRDQVVL
ncbi:unnamed protein product [Prorocentrum cordatum]|uniref:Condensin complex subunit 2 n=1 Tax=Prorocentrum cordatum TaxID=2364126 RepID=A0ABN9TD94_9DINO|nr:unnamed protein product [Polarella glacialis]